MSRRQVSARALGKRAIRARWLCRRLDSYVEKAEAMKPDSKGRASWMRLADAAREELRKIDH